jgi:uncharacterized protein (DUF302 family)
MLASTKNGIVQLSAMGGVDTVVDRLLTILRAKAITVFAVVDHSGEAEKVGLRMPNTKLVIFGDARAGTPLMLDAPSSALDLPLKILIAEGTDGNTRITYNAVAYLQMRHGLSNMLIENVVTIENIVEALAH